MVDEHFIIVSPEYDGFPFPERDDVEVAVALARLLHDELVTYATEGPQQLASDDDMREALLALCAMAGRLGIRDFKVPFRDFSGFLQLLAEERDRRAGKLAGPTRRARSAIRISQQAG